MPSAKTKPSTLVAIKIKAANACSVFFRHAEFAKLKLHESHLRHPPKVAFFYLRTDGRKSMNGIFPT